MKTNEKLAELLNDLTRINNDRIEGYEKAANEVDTSDMDLKVTFTGMADDSRKIASDLKRVVVSLGEEPTDDSTVSGKIYRTWMDVKNAFSSNDRLTVLESCEYGEDAAQKAYNSALDSDVEMSSEIRQLISSQQQQLRKAHDLIKKYRDAHETVS